MKDLDPLNFTVELGRFYEMSRQSGTVSVTMKRMTSNRVIKATRVNKTVPKGGEALVKKDESLDPETTEYPCLVRATFKNKKISTIVPSEDFDEFQAAYGTIIRAFMDSLKKKERKKKPKTATTTTAAK